MRRVALLFILASAACLVSCGDGATAPTRLRLATTTSTENSGLLAWLLPPFEEAENLRVETIADEKHAYVLADRGTVLAFGRKVDLVVLVEGDPELRNPYGVIRVNPDRHAHVESQAALALVDCLTSPEGQARIAAFRKNGEVLFHPHRLD